MKLTELANRAKALPDCRAFNWPGAEQFSDLNFDEATADLPKMRAYVKSLKDRMSAYSIGLSELGDAYRQLRDLILEFEVDRP